MDINQRKYNSQIEINNLIDDAVNNAVARRNQDMDSQDMSALSNEEAAKVAGGLSAVAGLKPICPPITIGIIAVDPTTKSIL